MSLYSTALSGLNAGSIALAVTSNNITNVKTAGYNRQVISLDQAAYGNGVQVGNIERQYNKYVTQQFNSANSANSGLVAYHNQISQIDSLLADSESSLAVQIQGYFAALQTLGSAPADPATRQGVIGSAQNLSAQFRSMDNYLSDMQDGVNGEVKNQVTQINNISKQIADLNREISLAKAKTGEAPNAMLDQRDLLVSELSQRVDVKVTVQDSGTYNVSFSNGLSLVSGFDSNKLEAVQSNEDPTRTTVGYRDGGGNLIHVKESTIKSGELGGILQFRSETLDSAQNRLGQLAVGMGMAINKQHEAGVDLNGNPGTPMFSVGDPQSYSNAKNTSTSYLTGTFTDGTEVGINDYDIAYSSATGYTVTNKQTGENVGTFPVGSPTLSFGGMTLTMNGTPADGDKFLVKPVSNAARDFDSLITDPVNIAAGDASGSGAGDNRNALAMYKLQSTAIIKGGSTANQAYASLVNEVGNKTNIIKVNQTTQQTLSEQLLAVQQSESGVNLDEEATNLLRFQQYYQASARIVDTASSVMDTILGLRS
ncbi:flagellar hook-associated protein FlgK [Pseudomonas sp. PLMAX]|jgi:flagellar hook-associated protein 1 FlgK|uniref:flagellar hook-associated protein FlgK n=1 Tax=Pseudomonas sp. PLMAX TaxID=2201998 RepID=UPI0038B70FA6